MITLDGAIMHCEEVAETKEKEGSLNQESFMPLNEFLRYRVECLNCASEHRQLAEWLRKLKKYEEGIEKIKELMNDYKGCDMWDTANGMQFALECLEVNADDDT